MRVRVKTEFRDKYTGELHKTGDELNMSVERINEILKVDSFIELLAEQSSTDDEQEAEEQPKQKVTRSRRRVVKKE